MSHPITRSVICEICNRPRQTQCWLEVCTACARHLPKMRCDACNKRRFQLQPDSPVCHGCLNKLLREKISCACGLTDYAFIVDPTHCRKCHCDMARRNWKKSLPKTIVCLSCGAEKRGWKKTEMICQACDNKRRNGEVNCMLPGCKKRMSIKKTQLCRQHHEDRQAPTLLREYFETYFSPFPHNQRYMAEFAATINWEAVENGLLKIRGRDLNRFRAFGSFLGTNELPKVLTWPAIDQALPPLGQANAVKIGFIRSCLFELGDLFADRLEMQDRSSHLHERALRRSLQRSPVFREHVAGFQQWLLKGMLNPAMRLSPETEPLTNAPRTIIERVNSVTRFLNFCVARDIVSLPEISPEVISDYQRSMLWQFECKTCHLRSACESLRPIKKCANKRCEATVSYVRIRRLTRATFISNTSHLRVFFDWAKLHQMVKDNPLSTVCCGGARTFTVRGDHGELVEIAAAIRRYDEAAVEKLCASIVSPEADPEEAIVLYFTIFHLLTNSDLRNLRIPSHLDVDRDLPHASNRAEGFEYVYLPLRQSTRGKRSLTRTATKILFPRKASSWLVPLLKRYYEKRAGVVKAQHQQHFLVSERTTRSNKPVTKCYVADRVRKASLRVLGGTVTASDLRRTAADIIAQRSKRRGAILTAMGYSALTATRFNYLERFPLQPKKTHSTNRQSPSSQAKQE